MPASRADLLRPLPSLTEVRNRTPAADEELRCMSNHLVKGVASTDRIWGGINGRHDSGSIRARVKPSRVQLAVSKPAQALRAAAQTAALRSPCRDLRAARDGPDRL